MNQSQKSIVRVALIGFVVIAASQQGHAGALGMAVGQCASTLKDIAGQISTVLGPVMTVIGGGRASWRACHGESFTTELIQAIAGCAIFAAATL